MTRLCVMHLFAMRIFSVDGYWTGSLSSCCDGPANITLQDLQYLTWYMLVLAIFFFAVGVWWKLSILVDQVGVVGSGCVF